MKPVKQNSKGSVQEAEESLSKNHGYRIIRFESGFCVEVNGKRVTEPNVWAITMHKLEVMLRQELEL